MAQVAIWVLSTASLKERAASLLLDWRVCFLQGAGTYLTDRTIDSGRDRPALFTPDAAARLEGESAMIVHFTGPPTITPAQLLNPYVRQPSKPWAYICLNPFKHEFYTTLDTTPWAGFRPAQDALAAAAVDDLLKLCSQLHTPGEVDLSDAHLGSGDKESTGCLSAAVCGAAGFDAQTFMRSVAALCLETADNTLQS